MNTVVINPQLRHSSFSLLLCAADHPSITVAYKTVTILRLTGDRPPGALPCPNHNLRFRIVQVVECSLRRTSLVSQSGRRA